MQFPPKTPGSTVSPARFIRRLAAVCLLINLFVIALVALSLGQSHNQYEARAAITAQNLARLIEQSIGGSIEKIDVVLLDAKHEIETELAGGGIDGQKLNSYLVRHAALLSEVDGLRMLNARGDIVYGKGVKQDDLKNAADRDYYKRLRNDPNAGLYISRPFVSRIIGRWVIILARRVNHPDGSFAGVVYGVIPLQHFLGLFASIDVGAHGTITLRDGELGIVARYPEPRGVGSTVGQKIVSREFLDLIRSGRGSGTYKARQPVDKIVRTFSYRKFSGYPLLINVGLATDDYLDEWRSEFAKMAAAASLFLLVTVIISWLVYRDWQRGKAAVQTLSLQEKKFHTIADYTYDWEFWLSPSGGLIYSSPSCKRMTGYDAEEFYADPDLLRRILHPEDLERFDDHCHDANSVTRAEPFEFRVLLPDGSHRWLEHVCQPIIDESGAFLGTRGSNRDITMRKMAEEAIRESETRFRMLTTEFQALLNGLPDAVALISPNLTILWANNVMAQVAGFEHSELLGRHCYELLHGRDESCEGCNVLSCFKTGEENIRHVQLRDTMVMEVRAVPVKGEGGDVIKVIEIGRDVTEQKKAEHQLLNMQKMEAVGQLAGGIAHDFNNLLTAIIGNISLLKILAPQEDQKISDRLAAAETASNRAKELTQRLLTFSRGGAPVRKTTSLAELVRESAGLALSGSQIVCDSALSDDLWPVYVDEGQISQVLGNLFINALQAMPDGGKITVTGENVYYDSEDSHTGLQGRFVSLSITDEGMGIANGHLGRIFDPFFTTKETGRGLGLATSFSIIKNHKGHISVETKEGFGTTFTICLPASESPVTYSHTDKDQPVYGTGKVLLMDDEEIVRETAREIIEQIGYTAELANNGEEAIELYESALKSGYPFDVVIMDLTIPGGMGGKEAALHLKKIDPGVKAIVSSGYSNDPIMANYLEYGFVEVVSKPYNVGELSRKLEAIMNRGKNRA